MLALILSLLKIVGGIFGNIAGTETAVAQANAQIETAAIVGAASVERQWWFVSAAVAAFAIIFIPYDFKAVVWDNVFMNGATSTPALHGDLEWVHLTVVGGLFLRSFK